MPMSQYAEQAILNLLLGGAAYSAPSTVYVALSTGLATAAVVEPSGGAYARVAVTNNSTNFPAATGGSPASKANGTAITFPTATGSWGTVQSVAIYDAATAGNLLFQGNLATSQLVNSGGTLSFATSALSATLS